VASNGLIPSSRWTRPDSSCRQYIAMFAAGLSGQVAIAIVKQTLSFQRDTVISVVVPLLSRKIIVTLPYLHANGVSWS
jgi:hypothetical protein